MSRRSMVILVGLILAGLVATTVMAAVIFDIDTGEGFVGKGDVQTVFGWNNKELQDNAANVQFQMSSEVVTEISWECTNSNNENIQERQRTTSTTIQGLLSSESRVKTQVTGFNLTGYDGQPTTDSQTGGPPLNSCPSGPWTLTTPAGDPVVVSSSSSLEVSIDGIDWIGL